MRRRLIQALLTASLGGCVLGCQVSPRSYPEAPLLLSKKPVEGKLETQEPTAVAKNEPAAPALAPEVLASMPKAPSEISPSSLAATAMTGLPPSAAPALAVPPPARPSVPARTAVSAKMPVPALPATRLKVPEPATPAKRAPDSTGDDTTHRSPLTTHHTRVPGTYGHDSEYAWLQGVIDKHYRGHIYLRFCDPTVEDPWGGKVRIEDDPRLSQFQDGDVVFVEGNLVTGPEAAPSDSWNHFPRYRIRSATLVQRKNEPVIPYREGP